MRILSVSAIVIVLGMTAAGAQDLACGFTGPTIFPELEALEAAMLKGDYSGFASLVQAAIPTIDGAGMMAGITEAVPTGFVSCTTIIQREDVGGFVQEISMFELPEGKGVITLYLQSALVNGERTLTQFSFDSALTKTLENLR